MLTILDRYILKRYLVTFSVMIMMFIPIGIIIDISEKVNKMIENKVPFEAIASYYFDFTIYFANLLFPIFLFLSIIWFTSKLAGNTEIVAMLSSGISFTRFLRPYIVGATIVFCCSLMLGFFLLPKASEGFNNFRYTYLMGNGLNEIRKTSDVFKQISADEYIYVGNFNQVSNIGFKFSMEKFKGQKLLYKVTSERIKWNARKKNYTLFEFKKRTVGEYGDRLEVAARKDTVFNINVEDLTPTVYVAETLGYTELNKFIESERKRGSSNIDSYLVVLYKRYSVPVSAFILTIIAVAVASIKRRGGMGLNLAIGIALAFTFVFFDKIFSVLASKSTFPPIIAVWIPNFSFGILAIYLLRNAKK